MNEIKQIQANGITFAYYEAGEGPLLLCIHGFPDTPVTWRETMSALAADGYRVVAPYTRGYYPTTIPSNHSYTPIDLGSDVLALIDAFGAKQAIVIGHDWGALAAYAAANIAPEKISKLVTVAIPHPRALKPSLTGLWSARHFITFQFRRLTMQKFKRDNFAFVDDIYRRWAPTWDFPASETEPTKRAFGYPGVLKAVLGYYWSFASSLRDKEIQRVVNRKTTVNTLTLVGESDGALSPDVMDGSPKAFSGAYQYEILTNVGHFLHREQPEQFLHYVKGFLNE